MWTFIITTSLCQGIFSLENFRTSDVPLAEFAINPETFLNVTEIICYHGYPSEEYPVVTEDGYILTIFRIPYGRYNGANKGPRPAVLLYHGFLGDAANWISNQPSNSLSFILADAGYDVWLGNSRGNAYSSRHRSLKPSDTKFWEFSFHEMGYYDIPAVVDFILKKSWQQQIYYVGHSEGLSIGFIAFSTWPKLAERIKVFFALAPPSTVTFSRSPVTKLTTFPESLFRSRLDMYSAHAPAGTSVQNGLHWYQVYNGKLFRAYDYGSKEKNMAKYNQTTPPIYKISEIKIPIAIWTGGKDLIVDQRDAAILVSRISNVIY
ncbi:gastric triacylglycerol lipase-like [Sceloporus undulatus]|uniref:gastric triacylglycerol lipase-like n=1 Tax=Sceloporus undulatus TaxID=8520 RepID=UPI001C4B8585|nr:gastric triacylglycerol lipase-like [Sceloporus undulatus]